MGSSMRHQRRHSHIWQPRQSLWQVAQLAPFPAACRVAVFLCLAAAGVMALTGCSGGTTKTIGSPTAGLKCIDDSPSCIAQRQATLKYFLSSPDRAWVRQRPDAKAYASGVRLFAYKRQKTSLSCSELKSGMSEAGRAPAALRGGSGLSPAQVSRGKMLAREVARELKREHGRRCRSS